jgi:hypothetical protein
MDHKESTGKKDESIQNNPVIQALQTDSPIWGGCHMATGTASHILCECVTLPEFRIRRPG